MNTVKLYIKAAKPFIKEILGDFMLIACLIAPILAGCVFHFVFPYCERLICTSFGFESFFAPYYLLIDIFLSVLCTVMFSFSGIMVMLSELDDMTAKSLIVTPVGKGGYFFSRIGIPAIISIFYSLIVVTLFNNSGLSFGNIAILSVCSASCAIIVSMIVVVLAKNKVEGMALAKMTGLLSLGAIIPYIITSPIQYVCAFLPYFWITRFFLSYNYLNLLPFVLTSVVWIFVLSKRFVKRFC